MTASPRIGGNRRFTLLSLAEVIPCDVVPLIAHIELFYPGRIKPGRSTRFREIEAFEIRKSYRSSRRVRIDMYRVQLGIKSSKDISTNMKETAHA